MWFWCEWTPPGDRRPSRWAAPPLFRIAAMKAAKRSFLANEPSAIAWSMRGSSCITTRPAPRFMCPTSELPICPLGRPTNSSLASSSAWGLERMNRSQFGVAAMRMALSGASLRWPQPSRMHSTTGRGTRPDGAAGDDEERVIGNDFTGMGVEKE